MGKKARNDLKENVQVGRQRMTQTANLPAVPPLCCQKTLLGWTSQFERKNILKLD